MFFIRVNEHLYALEGVQGLQFILRAYYTTALYTTMRIIRFHDAIYAPFV